MKPMTTRPALYLLCAVLLAPGAAVQASERYWQDEDRSHDRARHALQRGEVLPLPEMLGLLQAKVPGDVIEVEFEEKKGMLVYEFKVIDPQGRRLEVYMDATNGELLSIEDD